MGNDISSGLTTIDRIFQYLEEYNQIISNSDLEKFRKFLIQYDYDTDAMRDDVEGDTNQSNITEPFSIHVNQYFYNAHCMFSCVIAL